MPKQFSFIYFVDSTMFGLFIMIMALFMLYKKISFALRVLKDF